MQLEKQGSVRSGLHGAGDWPLTELESATEHPRLEEGGKSVLPTSTKAIAGL